MDYDAIIAGGGPAGLSAAITIAEKGYSTCLIEGSKVFGYPIHDSGATFAGTITEFNLSNKVIANVINGITLVSPKGHIVSRSLGDNFGYILERGQLNKELAIQATRLGVGIKMPEKAVSPLLSNDFVRGMKTKNLLTGSIVEYSSKIVIDATGVNATLAKSLGIHPGLSNIRWAIGAEYEMANVELESPSSIELYFGSETAPYGYGWIFPKGKDIANVGVGITSISDFKFDPNKYLLKFITEHPIASEKLRKAQSLEYHKGILPVGPMLNSFVTNGFMAIGDAACQASPQLGEGIRFVMKSGKIAGEVAIDAINENNFSKESLKDYETRLRKEIYPNYDISYRIHKYACSKDNESWERTINKIAHLDSESEVDLLKKVLRGDIRKSDILASGPSLAMKAIKHLLMGN